MTQATPRLHAAGQTATPAPGHADGVSETTIKVKLDNRLLETVDKLSRVSEESREQTAARLIAAGIAHRGFRIPAGVPC